MEISCHAHYNIRLTLLVVKQFSCFWKDNTSTDYNPECAIQPRKTFVQADFSSNSYEFLPRFFFLSPPPPSPPLFFATIDDLYLNILLALFFFSHFLALASTSLAHSVFYSSAFAHTAFCRNRESIIVHHAFSFHVRFSRTVKLFATHSHMYSRRKFLSTQADMYASRRASSAAMS